MSTILARLAALEQRAKMQSESFAEMMSGGAFIMADIMTREAWQKARTEYVAKLTGPALLRKGKVSARARRRVSAHRSAKISGADTVC